MKKLGPAFVCFGIFLAGCGDRVENPSAGANPSSHHLSKNYESVKQLQPSQSIYDGSRRKALSKVTGAPLEVGKDPTSIFPS